MKREISISEIVYLLYFSIMFGARAIGLYEGMMLYNVSLIVGMLLFALKIATTEHTLFEYLVMFVLLSISLLVYHNTGEKGLLLYMTMVLGMKGVSLKRVEKIALTVLGICFPLLVFLSVVGIIKDIAYKADSRLLPGEMLRRSLGYPYFNTMFTTYIVLVVLIMLVRGYRNRKSLILWSLFLFLVGAYLYVYSCSNTGMIVLTIFLLANLMFQNKSDIGKYQAVLANVLYPLGMAISIILPVVIKGNSFSMLDKILHNRLNYANYYLTHEPVTLFGVRFQQAPNDNYIIDSSYLYSFLQLGIVPCIILTAFMIIMINRLIRENKRIELAVVVSFCILGLSDPFFFNLSYKNIMMLFVGEYFYMYIEKISNRLPKVFNNSFSIIESGKIEFVNNAAYIAWKRMGNAIGGVFDCYGTRKFTIMIIVALLMFFISFKFMDADAITGIVDTISEWEYFRKSMSVGLWSGIGVVALICLFGHNDDKSTS